MPKRALWLPLIRAVSRLVAVLLLNETSCNYPSQSGDPGLVTNLRFAPSAFDSFKRNTELRFTLGTPRTLSIAIARTSSAKEMHVVKTLIVNAAETKGSHSVAWLGDNDGGYFAPAGIYLGVVTIDDQRYSTTVQVFHF